MMLLKATVLGTHSISPHSSLSGNTQYVRMTSTACRALESVESYQHGLCPFVSALTEAPPSRL